MKVFSKKSFSLIELLIALALVVILICLTLPRTTIFARTAVTSELNKLFIIFSYLQQRAIATNQAQDLFFDVKNNTYFFTFHNKPCTQKVPTSIIFGYKEGIKGPPATPTKPIIKAVTFPEIKNFSRAKFMTNGKITPGTIYITDKNKQYQGALTCPISQVSYVRRYVYENHHWGVV